MLNSEQKKRMYEPIALLINETMCDVQHRDMGVSDEKYLPNTTVLNKGFDSFNHNHKKLQFITQNDELPFGQLAYEERIFSHGIIATRNNWHDYFNALVWKRYPHIKSALNAIHHQEMIKQNDSLRSRQRDLLTLFDECGVIVIADEEILSLIRNHQWHDLFVEHKNSWVNKIIFLTFGHAMFEKYLQPYIGMTAQALLLPIDSLVCPLNIEKIDAYLGDAIVSQALLTTKADLSPLPVLGIPGWYDKQDDEFYANSQYFRPLKSCSRSIK